jgi:hypothetical protein
MKNELNVKAEKKWGEEGYKKEEKDSDKKWGLEQIKIESISSNDNNINNNYYSNNESKNNKKNKKLEEEDPNKKKLMLDLFGGMDSNDIKPEKKVNNKNEIKNNQINKNDIVQNKPQNNTFNLFEGLTQNFSDSNKIENKNDNISNLKIMNNPNIFSMSNNTNNYNIFSPYYINTDKFGELWESFPDEDSYNTKSNINSPQKFHEIIKNRGNFAPVDIINNEAISAANYKNQIALVHAVIEANEINFLVKCQNKSLNNEVADFVIKLYN